MSVCFIFLLLVDHHFGTFSCSLPEEHRPIVEPSRTGMSLGERAEQECVYNIDDQNCTYFDLASLRLFH